MKHVKVYENFDSDELERIAQDLDTLGLVRKFRVECNIFVMIPAPGVHALDWPEWAFRNIETRVLCKEDDEIILERAFEKVLNGDFDIESNVHVEGIFKSAPELKEILSKEHMIELAEKVNKLGPLDSKMHEKGKLYTLQAEFLLDEVLGAMESRAEEIIGEETPQGKFFGQTSEIKHLRENIGWNVRIHKE